MELSSPKLKALSVTLGFSFWFYIITSILGVFSIETFVIFVGITILITQIFSVKLSKGLDAFAILNTKVFLGILFVTVFSTYGLIFRVLGIDLMRLKKQKDTYWIEMEQLMPSRILKQY